MALNQLGLGLLLSAKDMASGVIDTVRGKLEKLGQEGILKGAEFTQGVAMFGKGAAMLGAGVAGVTAIFGLAEAAQPFEASMGMVAYRTQASAEEMQRLRGAATAASESLKIVSETEAGHAMAVFAKGGNDAADTMTALNPILKFAKANFIDVGQAATFADEMMDKYGVQAGQIEEKTNKAQWVMRRFGLEMGDLSGLFGPLAQMAKNAGQSFDDMLLLFGAAAEVAGPRGAMMSLRGAMTQLADPDFAKKMRKSFAGVRVEGLEKGTLRPLTELLPDMAAAMDTMTESQRAQALQSVFGGRAAGGLAAILDKLRTGVKGANGELLYGAAAMRALTGEMNASTGEVDKALGAITPYQRATEEARVAWDNLKRTLGETLLPPLAAAMSAFSTVLRAAAGIWRSIPAPAREFIGVLAAATSALLVIGGAILMVKGVLAILGVAMTVFSATTWAALAPLLPVLLPLAAIILGIWLAVKYGDQIAAGLARAWAGLKDVVSQVGSSIKQFFVDIGEWFAELPSRIWGWLEETGASIGTWLNDQNARWWAWLEGLGQSFANFFTETLPNTIASTAESVGRGFMAIVTRIGKVFSEDIPNAIRAAYGAIKEAVLSIPIIGPALSVVGKGVDLVKGQVGDMLDYMGLDVGSPVSVEPGGLFDVVQSGFAVPPSGMAAPAYQPAVAWAEAQQAQWREPVVPPRPAEAGRAQLPPINVSVQVDGEEIARAVERGNRSLLQRKFGEPPPEGATV